MGFVHVNLKEIASFTSLTPCSYNQANTRFTVYVVANMKITPSK